MESRFTILLSFGILFIVWKVNATVDCSKMGTGRFAIPDDTTCRNYTLCVYISSIKSYVPFNYSCPSKTVFNPNTSKCTASSNYVSNVTTTNPTTAVCTEEGFTADPDSTDCSSFITCVDSVDDVGNYTEAIEFCPKTTLFNPKSQECESDYICPADQFKCSAGGRFANSTDTTCKTYYMCVKGNNGSYTQYGFKCPGTSVFNPNIKLCTANYPCK